MDDGAAEMCGDYSMQPSADFTRRRAVALAISVGKIAGAREGIADALQSSTTRIDRSSTIAGAPGAA
jgi:hypothetical protein